MSSNEDDDDVPRLSSSALSALQEFLSERSEVVAAENAPTDPSVAELTPVSEDWQLSQFWYSDSTAASLADEVLAVVDGTPKALVACVSCPTLYKSLVAKSASTSGADSASTRFVVLEFDRRFAKWGEDFVFYDYREPNAPSLPSEFRGAFDFVVCDPPFLTTDCVSATFETAVGALSKKGVETPLMFCTGAVMEDHLKTISGGRLKRSSFAPEHASKLSNPFMLMTNFETKTL